MVVALDAPGSPGPTMRGWSWYDRRTGERATSATFLSYQAALDRLNYWHAREDRIRSDLAVLLGNVEVREIEQGDDD
jgi:hypothetical protein